MREPVNLGSQLTLVCTTSHSLVAIRKWYRRKWFVELYNHKNELAFKGRRGANWLEFLAQAHGSANEERCDALGEFEIVRTRMVACVPTFAVTVCVSVHNLIFPVFSLEAIYTNI